MNANPHLSKQMQYNVIEQQLHYKVASRRNRRLWSTSKVPTKELPTYLKKDPFLWKIFKRLHYEDKNLLMIVVGETGVGKSCTAVDIADKIDITPLGGGLFRKNFVVAHDEEGYPTPETRIVFSASDFIRLVSSGLPKGSVIIWDEAGIGNDNTNWYDKKSKLVKHIMQSFRAQNLCLILTVPDEESVALATRRLVHCVLDVYERNTKFAKINIQWLQRNRKSGTVYRKTTIYQNLEGELTKVANYMVRKLPPYLETPYNTIKHTILGNLNRFYEKEMKAMEELEVLKVEKNFEEKKRKFDLVRCTELVQDNYKEVFDSDKEKVLPEKIMFLLAKRNFDCSSANAKTIIANLPKALLI